MKKYERIGDELYEMKLIGKFSEKEELNNKILIKETNYFAGLISFSEDSFDCD